MYNIHLICTMHRETGFCNANALYDIIENIRPQVIFEELNDCNFDRAYNTESLITLETSAIKMYLGYFDIIHIPVDNYPRPEGYEDESEEMLKKVCYSKTIKESHQLRRLLDSCDWEASQHGFTFLNSDRKIKYNEAIEELILKVLDVMGDEVLKHIYRLDKEVIAHREHDIIKNIYDFSRDNIYETAIMFIGSGHRTSIREVVSKFEQKDSIKLNWKIY